MELLDKLRQLEAYLAANNVMLDAEPAYVVVKDAIEAIKDLDMISHANRRGVERWRAANPGNKLVLIGQANLVQFLIGELDKARAGR